MIMQIIIRYSKEYMQQKEYNKPEGKSKSKKDIIWQPM